MRQNFDENRNVHEYQTQPKQGLCTFCGRLTLQETLIEFGARCGPCYDAYRRDVKPAPYAPKAIPGDPHAWAKKLRYREEAGERLTTTQKEAWRKVLLRDQAVQELPAEVIDRLKIARHLGEFLGSKG